MDFNMKKSLFLHTLTSWTLSLSLGLGFMAHVGCANAQLGNFPSRPIKIIVPFVPGGTLDSVARLLAKHLTESLPQAVIVDNKGGGGGIVGVDYVAKSAPDGYTLVFNAATPMVTVVSLQKTPYDVSKDLAALNQVATFDYILAVNAKSPIRSIEEFIQLVKKDPNRFNYASAGNGSGQHLYMELAKSAAGIQLQNIPFKGNGPAMQSLLASEVDCMFDTSAILPLVQSHRLRALMTSSAKPLPAFPGVPTIESLFPGSSIQGWNGAFVPAATPKEIQLYLSDAIRKAVVSPDMSSKLKDLGMEPSSIAMDAFSEIVKRDLERWGKIIRDNNIKAD
jgi:tripartite-type tricarboxylate transporter receptor subunit TctC